MEGKTDCWDRMMHSWVLEGEESWGRRTRVSTPFSDPSLGSPLPINLGRVLALLWGTVLAQRQPGAPRSSTFTGHGYSQPG